MRRQLAQLSATAAVTIGAVVALPALQAQISGSMRA